MVSAEFWSRREREETPITPRPRAAGQTQVYRLCKLPGIGWTYVTGLLQIWQDYRHLSKCTSIGAEEGL